MKKILTKMLHGIAVGDAVGNSLEFKTRITLEEFEREWGRPTLRVSDDTQMTLFCLNSLLANSDRAARYPKQTLMFGYLDWLETQRSSNKVQSVGLLQFQSLYNREAPGTTCMGSLTNLAKGVPVENDSKGAGTVMRCAPIAWWGYRHGLSPVYIYSLAKIDALLTHKHKMAWEASVLLSAIYLELFKGYSIKDAVESAITQTFLEISRDIPALLMPVFDPYNYERMLRRMGGWVAEEALVLAVGAVMHGTDYKEVIRFSATIDGDSDTVAGIAGGLAAVSGKLPPLHMVERLNVLDAIEYGLALAV